jgi:LmbE family N-acetylglucosaminyl deacetylase
MEATEIHANGCDAPVVLHVSPHPDDEVLGAGATLLALRRSGWRVVNLACGLGRPGDHERRGTELTEALSLLGFDGVTLDPPAALSATDDLEAAVGRISQEIRRLLDQTGASLIISPHLQDGHHAHEAVARAVADAGIDRPGLVWWSWGLWADLACPTLYLPFDGSTLLKLVSAMEVYAGENSRNSYLELIPSRARSAAILGTERVFGYGTHRVSILPYAEVLREMCPVDGQWVAGPARIIDPVNPLSR